MSNARNLADVISGNYDIPAGSLDNVDLNSRVAKTGDTMTGDLIVDGNVGIGTSSPSSFYSLADNLVVGTGSGGNGLTVYSGSADSGFIGFNDTVSASMQAFIQYNHSGDYMAFAPNGGEKMRIDSVGRVTKPYQPTFKAGRTAGHVSATSTIVFNVVNTNIGGHYNSSTGAFTTPIAGRYLFTTGLFSVSGTTVFTEIRVNGSSVAWTIYTGTGYGTANHSVVLDLNANDAVTVVVSGGQLYAGGGASDCYFSGTLLG